MLTNQVFMNKQSWAFSVYTSMIIFLILAIFFSGCVSVPKIDHPIQVKAIEGDAKAQYEIGEIYRKAFYKSLFSRSSFFLWEEASKWYEMSANQGYAKAQYWLSVFFFTFRHDYESSFLWTQKAALQGVAEAQHSLGMHYAQAWGTPQNLILAYKWIALAFEGDISNPNGRVVSLEWLISKGEMSPKQVSEGQRLAADHIAAHGRSWSIDPGRRTLLEIR